MTQKNKKGMRFCQGAYYKERNANWFVQTFALLTLFMSVIVPAVYTTGLWSTDILLTALITGGYICIMYAVLAKFGKENLYNIIVLVLLLLLVLFLRSQFIEGMSIVWNKIGNTYTAGTGIVIPDIEVNVVGSQKQLSQVLFSAVVSTVAALACCMITSYLPILAGIIPLAIIMAESIIFDVNVPFAFWVIVCIASIYLLVYSCWQKNKLTSAVTASWIICMFSAAIITSAMMLLNVDDNLLNLSQKTEQFVHEKRYETSYTTLPEGDLKNYKTSGNNGEQALSVSMSEPQQMYLRGFVGTIFEDDVWTSFDKKLLAKNEQLLYWFNLNGYNPNTQFAEASKDVDLQENKVTIYNAGACSKYMYVPFSIKSGEYINLEDLNIDSVAGNGQRTYTYMTVSGGSEAISTTLQKLQKSNDSSILDYRKAESAYRSFVYDNYLQVPESIIELYGEYWDNLASKYNSADNLTNQQAQECALLFLSYCFPKEGTPDDIELPLQQADGTSYQYATVAALTMRYFGIPTRYAEGYVISEDMAKTAQPNNFIAVDSSCTRAWVEVYQDGIGWLPMDLTPGFGEFTEEQLENLNNSGLNDSDDPNAKEGDELEENPEDSEETPNPDGGFMVRVLKTVKKVFIVLLLIAVIVAIFLYIRRKIVLKKKNKLFNEEYINDSVAWIYADIAKLLEKLGFSRGNGSMTELYEDLKYRFGKEYADAFRNATALNAKAMFSSKTLDDNQRSVMMQFRTDTLMKLKTNIKWIKQQWIKWILCLY